MDGRRRGRLSSVRHVSFYLYIGRLRVMRITDATVDVALALMESPGGRHWGYDLTKRSGRRSGVLYPIVHRMLEQGWLEDGWEDQAEGRPPRRYYTVTDVGKLELGALVARARQDARFKTKPAFGLARLGLAR
jgi:PadR family transcriptional regulator PadR